MIAHRRSRIARALGSALVIAVVLPASASAQNPRTYVDRTTGSDANNCLYETPCLSFQRAHDVTSPDGEVNVKSPGNYSSVTITKPITIDGNGNAATITPLGMGVIVNLPSGSGRVVLRDIRINAAANLGTGGIDILRGARVTVDNVRIYGGSLAGIRVQNLEDPSVRLILDDSKIQGSSGAGLDIVPAMGSFRASIRHTKIDDNGGSALRMRPGRAATARSVVRSSHVDANAGGLVADAGAGGTAYLTVIGTSITDSGTDGGGGGNAIVASGSSATAWISGNSIVHNLRALNANNGGKILTAGDNRIVANTVNGAATGTWGKQ
jgi:hypothetical protein